MQYLIAPLANHLWQSTAFVAAVAVVCLALRNHSPRLRYWLWLAASLKFLVPFSVLVSLGASIDRPQISVPVVPALTVEQLSYAFAPAPPSLAAAETPAAAVSCSTALLCLWGAGFVGIVLWRFRQWESLYVVRCRAESVSLEFPLPVVEADSLMEPGIFGIVRPVLLLPRGLRRHLTDEQFKTLIAHELCHVLYRDNLTAAMHMAVEALFWFYPPVWWIGSKLIAERERACDQSVLSQGGSAEVYAASILTVCRRYLESPLPCASGVTGSELKTRIHEIMAGRAGRPLSAMRKAALAIAAVVAVSIPVAIGLLRTQTLPPSEYTYGVVSARPSASNEDYSRIDPDPHGGMQVENVAVIILMQFAYDVPAERFTDVPEWVTTDRFDVGFTPEREEMSFAPVSRSEGIPSDQVEGLMSRHRQRMQAILRDRFGLVLRAESRELPFYSITIAEGGSKLAPAANGTPTRLMITNPGRLTAEGADLEVLTRMLSSLNLLGRPVVDETGLDGKYDVELEWTRDPSMPPPGPRGPFGPGEPPGGGEGGGGSIFTALTDQLGLKAESRQGPAPVLVVEKIEKPEAN